MKRNNRLFILETLIIIIFVWLLLDGCALTTKQTESVLDAPEHHVSNGFKLIKKGWIEDAKREFELVLQQNPKYSPAHRGIGLAYGLKEQFNLAFESMHRARDYAEEKEGKALAYSGFMRLYTMRKDKGWLAEVEKNFYEATSIMEGLSDAYYHMGIAYKYGYRFTESKKVLRKVLEIDKRFAVEAKEQLNIIEKIEMAMPRSEIARRVALMDSITRADVAALFIYELMLDKIYRKAHIKEKSLPLPHDVQNHTLKKGIETVLLLDIEGLRPFPDGNFGPEEYITRANYALMISDIMATIENDPSLSTRYIGTKSPYRDVVSNAPYFTAVMVCTMRGGIMEAKHGIFDPMGKVSGADALFIIKRLKEELKVY